MKPLMDSKTVQAVIGIKESTLYALMKRGQFPKPIKVGRRSLWIPEEVGVWVLGRRDERCAKTDTVENVDDCGGRPNEQ